MKYHFFITILLTLLLVGCNTNFHNEYNIDDYTIDETYKNIEGISHYIGVVTKVGSTYINTRYQDESDTSLCLNISEYTKIFKNEKNSSLEDIRFGDIIHVIWHGEILETYPGQILNVLEIEVID